MMKVARRYCVSARHTLVSLTALCSLIVLTGCANTLPTFDPAEFSNWSKEHNDFPIYPKSSRELTASNFGIDSYMVSTGAPLSEVKIWYVTEPQNHGWTVKNISNSKEMSMFAAQKGNNQILLNLQSQNGKTFIGITYSTRQPRQ